MAIFSWEKSFSIIIICCCCCFVEESLSGGCVAREEKQSLHHFLFRSQSVIDFSWIRTSTVISTRTVSLSFAWKKLIIENRVQKRIPPVRFSYFLYLLFISFKTKKKKKDDGTERNNCLKLSRLSFILVSVSMRLVSLVSHLWFFSLSYHLHPLQLLSFYYSCWFPLFYLSLTKIVIVIYSSPTILIHFYFTTITITIYINKQLTTVFFSSPVLFCHQTIIVNV